MRPDRRVDANNPKTPEETLALTPVSIGIGEGVREGFLGCAKEAMAHPDVHA
jgi:hypothetical protein